MAPAGKGISSAAALILEDQLNRLANPKKKQQEKGQGLIPKGNESPFGDFPSELKAKTFEKTLVHVPVFTMAGQAAVDSSIADKGGSKSEEQYLMPLSARTPRQFLKKGDGSGGFSVSLRSAPPTPRVKRPVAGAQDRRPITGTEFRRFYDRGDLPVQIYHGGTGNKISWKVDISKLDYHHYLPIFFDGIREKEDPYRFLAVQGVYDMLDAGGGKVLPVVPQLIIPVKTALNTRDPEVIATTLKVLQVLVLSGEMIGEALVPYYRQVLPIFNIFKAMNLNCGDAIDYSQRKRLNLGDLIEETLEIFETHGGDDAFINIKYMLPTYESCVLG